MIIVSEENIKKAKLRVKKLLKTDNKNFMELYSSRQPNIMAYSFAMSELIPDKKYSNLLINEAIVIWQAFIIEAKKMPKVSDRTIMKIEDSQILEFSDISNLNDTDAALRLFKSSRQPNMLAYISDLLSADEDMPADIQSQIFSCLRVIIEALDQAINGLKTIE